MTETPTHTRRQEKLGWVGGWLGGFVWVVILAAVMFLQGRRLEGAIGLLISVVAVATVVLCSPWRHPRTQYRLLLAPVYGLLAIAIGWAVWAFGGAEAMGFRNGWALLVLVPVCLPLWIVGNRRWTDGDAK